MNTEKHGLDWSVGSSLFAGPAADAGRASQWTAQVSLINVGKIQSVFLRVHWWG